MLGLRRGELVCVTNDPGFFGDDRLSAAGTGGVAGGDEMLECPPATTDDAAVIPPPSISLLHELSAAIGIEIDPIPVTLPHPAPSGGNKKK
jgi:hypothetical protein